MPRIKDATSTGSVQHDDTEYVGAGARSRFSTCKRPGWRTSGSLAVHDDPEGDDGSRQGGVNSSGKTVWNRKIAGMKRRSEGLQKLALWWYRPGGFSIEEMIPLLFTRSTHHLLVSSSLSVQEPCNTVSNLSNFATICTFNSTWRAGPCSRIDGYGNKQVCASNSREGLNTLLYKNWPACQPGQPSRKRGLPNEKKAWLHASLRLTSGFDSPCYQGASFPP